MYKHGVALVCYKRQQIGRMQAMCSEEIDEAHVYIPKEMLWQLTVKKILERVLHNKTIPQALK